MATFPPPNYVPAESAVPGIEVYIPAPPEPEAKKAVLDFKCPNCGATTAYSVADDGLRCEYCGYYEPPQREVVGKGAQEFEFKVEMLEQAQQARGWGEARKVLQCQDCNALTTLPVTSLTYTCPFCGSNKVIQQEAAQDVLRPRFLIPFQVTAEDCQPLAREWLGSSWMTPGDLKRLASVAAFTPIYLPFWTFDAVTSADWRAQVGHTKTQRYRSGGEWKTRTTTVWRRESGHARRTFDDLPVPGTRRISNLLLDRIKAYDLRELVSYDPQYLAGIAAQAYDVELDAAWDIVRGEMREETRSACRDQASTSKIRNFSMTLDFSEESWRYVLLPVYIAVYRYGDAAYQVMLNGQTGVIAGQRPVDWTKVWLAIGALLTPGVILGLSGLVTAVLGVGGVIGVMGFVLLIIGAIVAFSIFRKAEELDDV